MKSKTASEVARALLLIFLVFGAPRDNGREFPAQIMQRTFPHVTSVGPCKWTSMASTCTVTGIS